MPTAAFMKKVNREVGAEVFLGYDKNGDIKRIPCEFYLCYCDCPFSRKDQWQCPDYIEDKDAPAV